MPSEGEQIPFKPAEDVLWSEDTYEQIANDFAQRNHKWNIGGELQVPTADAIKKTVKHAMTKISHDESISVGGLIIQKYENQYYLYSLKEIINETKS